MSRTIVFVHGAWVTPQSWGPFRGPFDAAGFTVYTPTWPYLDGLSPNRVNRSTPKGFGGLSVGRIADKYEAFIRELPEAPILVGHSFGGLIVQMLLDRGVGSAGVAIDPAPIGGIIPGPSAFAAIAPILLRINGWNRPYAMTRKRFGSLFANMAPEKLADEAYRTFVIPAPGKIFHQAALWLGTWVNPRRRYQPLLITGGQKDRLISPYLSRAAYRKQRRSPARTDYVEFPGRSHFLISEPGWEEVAAAALDWIMELPATSAVPSEEPAPIRRSLAPALHSL